MTTLKRTISVTNATSNLARVRDFLTDAARSSGVPHEDENRIILAVDEAVSNIMEHAYENVLEGTIRLDVDVDGGRFTITIHDSGKTFDPSGIPDPDLEEHIRGGKKRGLGLFLMRQVMDEVSFHYRAGGENVLTLVKYVD
jgi:serine/threonine-protein kinase RsbW